MAESLAASASCQRHCTACATKLRRMRYGSAATLRDGAVIRRGGFDIFTKDRKIKPKASTRLVVRVCRTDFLTTILIDQDPTVHRCVRTHPPAQLTRWEKRFSRLRKLANYSLQPTEVMTLPGNVFISTRCSHLTGVPDLNAEITACLEPPERYLTEEQWLTR